MATRALPWGPSAEAKRAAHKLVRAAVAAGRLPRLPCESCGRLRAVAHHENYAAPLVVVWLCRWCHEDRHAELTRKA